MKKRQTYLAVVTLSNINSRKNTWSLTYGVMLFHTNQVLASTSLQKWTIFKGFGVVVRKNNKTYRKGGLKLQDDL